jgi:AraC-like DNA-binding protein
LGGRQPWGTETKKFYRNGWRPYLDCQAHESFHRAAQTTLRLADLALGCGYYAQPHFINEFKSFSGLSPLEFLERTRHE